MSGQLWCPHKLQQGHLVRVGGAVGRRSQRAEATPCLPTHIRVEEIPGKAVQGWGCGGSLEGCALRVGSREFILEIILRGERWQAPESVPRAAWAWPHVGKGVAVSPGLVAGVE